MIRVSIFFATLLSLQSCNVLALEVIEKEGLYIYFYKEDTDLVARFTEPLPRMLAFLSARGLPVKAPVHVVLDELRDIPEVKVNMTPHKEVRIPIRAPGVLEDGYLEPDPWAYFMFKGLCLQGMFSLRSGIPAVLYKGFGEIISPNLVLPPWMDDGVCELLYSLYVGGKVRDPIEKIIFETTPVPDLDLISHHPEIWPGYYSFRIYGRPFIEWIYERYGWEKILEFLKVHGGGVIPWEIDLKAIDVFGKTGAGLWSEFQSEHETIGNGHPGLLVKGYWRKPFVYWNNAGVFPGQLNVRDRGRYGYVDDDGNLWISQYTTVSRIYRYAHGIESPMELYSLWDPGPGRVAVARSGHLSYIVVFPDDGAGGLDHVRKTDINAVEKIPAPEGVI